jgi:hypothetical protein
MVEMEDNRVTAGVVRLLSTTFSMRKNVLNSFNDLFFLHENNVKIYDIMACQRQEAYNALVDLRSIDRE